MYFHSRAQALLAAHYGPALVAIACHNLGPYFPPTGARLHAVNRVVILTTYRAHTRLTASCTSRTSRKHV